MLLRSDEKDNKYLMTLLQNNPKVSFPRKQEFKKSIKSTSLDCLMKPDKYKRSLCTSALICVIFLCSCASVPRKSVVPVPISGQYTALDTFCQNNGLEYEYNSVDDIIILSSSRFRMKVMLDSTLVQVNGVFYRLNKPVIYRKGVVYLPNEVESFLKAPGFVSELGGISQPIKVVVIDPGHGGKDPGAISKHGIKEKDINLSISLLLKQELEQRGITVYLTREKDEYLTLKERVNIGAYHDADLFLSIHSNANRSRNVQGVEIYHLSNKYSPSDAQNVVLAENAAFEFEENEFSQDIQKIVWDMVRVENASQSLIIGSRIIETLKRMGFRVNPLMGAPFYVLKYAYVPSVLIEVGYLSNSQEEKMLSKKQYQKQIAKGIALALERYNLYYSQTSITGKNK